MRYRLEANQDDELVVRNVETDLILGSVEHFWGYDPRSPSGRALACVIRNREGEKIATLNCNDHPLAPGNAAIAVANYEADDGYAGIKAGTCRNEPTRVERQLGRLLADAVSVIGRGLLEYGSDGLQPNTKRKFSELIAEIYPIWYASRYGSFNADRWATEAYFANIPRSAPRLSFGEAAQTWGMLELRMRYPEESDAVLKLVLSWPLDLFEYTLKSLMQDAVAPKQTKH
jgi:hypothetical protein